jgi:hypothetical protein
LMFFRLVSAVFMILQRLAFIACAASVFMASY